MLLRPAGQPLRLNGAAGRMKSFIAGRFSKISNMVA